MASISDQPALNADGSLHQHLLNSVAVDPINNPQLAAEIMASIADAEREFSGTPATVDRVIRRYYSFLDIAIPNIVHNKKSILLRRWLEDESRLSDVEVKKVLDYVSDNIVTKTKGAIAEMLAFPHAIRIAHEWREAGVLPAGARLVPGYTISERQRPRGAWHLGADGLFVIPHGDPKNGTLEIAGVLEIKSNHPKPGEVIKQMRNHLRRMIWGLRLDGEEWCSDRIALIRKHNKGWKSTPITTKNKILSGLLIVPSGFRSRITWPRGVVIFKNNTSAKTFSSIGHSMLHWLLEKIGEQIFANDNPWPGLSPEEAAINSFLEALYYLEMRDLPEDTKNFARTLLAELQN